MRISDNKIKLFRNNSRGFTLLETVLAVALLTIVTVIVYHGFMSMIHYSTNTSAYERTGQLRERDVKSGFTNSNPMTTSSFGLYLEDPGISANDKVIVIHRYMGGSTTPTLDFDPTYAEISNPPPVRRYGFVYLERDCPISTCNGKLRWYEAADGNIYEMCSNPECDWHTGP